MKGRQCTNATTLHDASCIATTTWLACPLNTNTSTLGDAYRLKMASSRRARQWRVLKPIFVLERDAGKLQRERLAFARLRSTHAKKGVRVLAVAGP